MIKRSLFNLKHSNRDLFYNDDIHTFVDTMLALTLK